jgi:hypothetical protein
MNIPVLAGFITRTILSILNFLSQLRTSVAIWQPSMTKTKVSVMYASMALDIRTGKVTYAATGSAITDDPARIDEASAIDWLLKVLRK